MKGFAVIVATLVCVAASLETVHVATTGVDTNDGSTREKAKLTVNAALRVVDDGGTIIVHDGTYTTGIYCQKAFTKTTTIKANRQYHAVFAGTRNRMFYSEVCTNLVVHGLDLGGNPSATDDHVVQVQMDTSHHITFENCILHDCGTNDIVKINNRAHHITMRGCVLYNPMQRGGDELIDINTVTDVIVEDCIMFYDFSPPQYLAHAFVVTKNSGDSEVMRNVIFRRNIFYNYQGKGDQSYLLFGEDEKDFYETQNVRIENNLFINNNRERYWGPVLFKGAHRNVVITANTFVGHPPYPDFSEVVGWNSVGFVKGPHDKVSNVVFANNIVADNSGQMVYAYRAVENALVSPADFAQLNNLYWNLNKTVRVDPKSVALPTAPSNLVHSNPCMPTVGETTTIVTSRYSRSQGKFASGKATIRDEFVRLVQQYGSPIAGCTSEAIGKANSNHMPADDILGRARGNKRDIGILCLSCSDTPDPVSSSPEPEPHVSSKGPEPHVSSKGPEPPVSSEDPKPHVSSADPEPHVSDSLEPRPEDSSDILGSVISQPGSGVSIHLSCIGCLMSVMLASMW